MKTSLPNHPSILRITAAIALACFPHAASAQLYTGTNSTGHWNSSRWNSTASGPFTAAWTANSAAIFGETNAAYTFTGANSSGTVDVGNVTLSNNVTVRFTGTSGTFGTGGAVRTINIGSNSLLDLTNNAITTAGGSGFIKTGDGVFATAGSAYNGGFTLDGGTMVIRGVGAMGSGSLTLSNGVIAANANRNLGSRYSEVLVRGNIQFGALSNNYAANAQSLISDTATLTFSNNMDLGGATRILTVGGVGTYAFAGGISNGSLTLVATAATSFTNASNGRFDLTVASGTNNSFSTLTISNGALVRVFNDGALGAAGNTIIIDGGRLSTPGATNITIDASRTIRVGDDANTSILANADVQLTFNGTVTDKAGEAGVLRKDGAGTLTLGGANNYTGATTIANNGGTLELAATGGNSAAGSTASVTVVGSTSRLLISTSEQVNNSANVTLSGGTIQRGAGASETFGNLTLTANSTLNFGGTAEDRFFKFGDLTLSTFTLGVSNFLLGNKLQYNAADYAAGEALANTFSFTSSDARGFSFNSGVFTITAIPEPSAVLAALGLAGVFLWPAARRLRRR